MTTAIGQAIGRWCDGEAFAYVAKCWAAIPAEKIPAMQGAWAVLRAVDAVSAPPLDEEFARKVEDGVDSLSDAEMARLTFWRAGHAHVLLCAVWGFAEAFCADKPVAERVDAAIRLCEKAEEWFHAKRLRERTRHEPLGIAYGKALENHRAGLELERNMKASAAGSARR